MVIFHKTVKRFIEWVDEKKPSYRGVLRVVSKKGHFRAKCSAYWRFCNIPVTEKNIKKGGYEEAKPVILVKNVTGIPYMEKVKLLFEDFTFLTRNIFLNKCTTRCYGWCYGWY